MVKKWTILRLLSSLYTSHLLSNLFKIKIFKYSKIILFFVLKMLFLRYAFLKNISNSFTLKNKLFLISNNEAVFIFFNVPFKKKTYSYFSSILILLINLVFLIKKLKFLYLKINIFFKFFSKTKLPDIDWSLYDSTKFW